MSSHEGALSGCGVLIVEDEYFLANDLEAALRSPGASVVGPFGEFGPAYLRAARDHFDVAFLQRQAARE